MLVRGLIVLLFLILPATALVSVYGYSNNRAESPSGTEGTRYYDNPLSRSTEGSCTMTTTGYTIACSNIPNDTGEFVANYINANSSNWPTVTAYTLHIENCIFPGNTLSFRWLPVLNTKIIIGQLHITTAVPITINENAFRDNNFQNITHLTLQGNIEQLNERCFAGLQHLEYLYINEGPIQSVAGGILKEVQNLKSLQIESGISDEHLNYFLWNTTLPKLTSLYIRFNNLNNLKSETFRGLSNLEMLEAGSSQITSIESTILESSAHIIQYVNFQNNELITLPVEIFNINSTRASFQVNLQQNKLTTLPKGIFDMAIHSSDTVAVYLQGNNWHCDCDLAWLRNYMDRKIIFKDEPMCISPEINTNKSFREADFSDCNTTTLPSASSTITTEAITSSPTETVTCETNTPSTVKITVDFATSTTETSDTTMLSTQDDNTALPTLGTDNCITSLTELSTDTTTISTQDTDNITSASTEVTTVTTTSSTEGNDSTTTPSTNVTTDNTTLSTQNSDNTTAPSTEITIDTTISSSENNGNNITSSTDVVTDTNSSSTLYTDNTITSSAEITTATITSSTEDNDNSIISSTEVTTDTNTSSTEDNVNTTISSTEVTTNATSSSTADTDKTITASTELTTISSSTQPGRVECLCSNCGTEYVNISTETSSETTTQGKNNIMSMKILEDEEQNKINVSIEHHNNHVLIWMTSNKNDGIDCNFKYCSSTGIEQFPSGPNTAYMICAAHRISEDMITISTSYCRAYTTLPSPPYRAWLQNKDRGTLLFIIFFALLVCVTAGAATIYYVLLHNPELINGNKRVIVVNGRTNQVIMIMPN